MTVPQLNRRQPRELAHRANDGLEVTLSGNQAPTS